MCSCFFKDYPPLGQSLWTSGQRQKYGDCKTPFVWKLLSGEIPFTYTHWTAGEPNCQDNVELCMGMSGADGNGWNDISCDKIIRPVCEYTPK